MVALSDIWTHHAIILRPLPPPERYVDFAGTITLPDGRGKGRAYNPSTHGPQLVLLQAMDGGIYFAPQPFREIAVAKPVQDGGSLATCVPLLRRVIRQRQAALIAFPSLDSAKDVWTTKISPILQAYGGQEPESGGGSKGGAARVITLPSGGRFFLRAAGGRGESQQASVTGDALCIDEVDDWPDLHRIKLITKRLEESGDPLLLLVSTVKLKENSLILSAVEEGTNTRLHYKCPDCGQYQKLEWENVRYERIGQACVGGSARIECVNCKSLWDETKRRTALFQYLVVHKCQSISGDMVTGPIPDTPRFSLLWNRIESPRKTLHSLCSEHAIAQWYIETKGEHGFMRSFYQDFLTRCYVSDTPADDSAPARITWDYLESRSDHSTYQLGKKERQEDGDSLHASEMTPEIEEFTLSCDVQRGGQKAPPRLYWLLTGWVIGDGRSYDTAWGSLVLCPPGRQATPGELHAGLDRLKGLVDQLAMEYGRPIGARGVDVADQQDTIREWLVRNPLWWAVRGAAGKMSADMKASYSFDLAGYVYRREQQEAKARWWLYLMDTDTCRQDAQNAFLVPAGRPGAAHLPKGLANDATLIRHYCALALVPDGKGGVRWSQGARDREKHPQWLERHDYLDNRTMAVALFKARNREKRAVRKEDEANERANAAPASSGWLDGYTSSSGGWLS